MFGSGQVSEGIEDPRETHMTPAEQGHIPTALSEIHTFSDHLISRIQIIGFSKYFTQDRLNPAN